jgi:hypothetical protein
MFVAFYYQLLSRLLSLRIKINKYNQELHNYYSSPDTIRVKENRLGGTCS